MCRFGRGYYSPEEGRWITCDPKGLSEGLNLYAFVNSNPLTQIDLYGLSAFADRPHQYTDPLQERLAQLHRKQSSDYREKTTGTGASTDLWYTHSAGTTPNATGRPKAMIGFVGGLSSDQEGNISNMEHISQLAGGANVHGVLNKTCGPMYDLIHAVKCNYTGLADATVQAVVDRLNWMYEQVGPKGKILWFSMSNGGAITRRAFEMSSEEVRSVITSVTIGSAQTVPNNLVAENYNYTGRDIVPYVDIKANGHLLGNMLGSRASKVVQMGGGLLGTLVQPNPNYKREYLPPAKSAGLIDHSFQSESYKGKIVDRIDKLKPNYEFL